MVLKIQKQLVVRAQTYILSTQKSEAGELQSCGYPELTFQNLVSKQKPKENYKVFNFP